MATQRLPDGSIEGPDPFNSWADNGTPGQIVLAQVTGTADHGSKYGQATINTTSSRSIRSQELPCSPGDRVSVGGKMSDSSDGSAWQLGIRFVLAGGGGSNVLPTATVPGAAWGETRRVFSAIAPADTIGVRLNMNGAAGTSGRTVKFDALLVSIGDASDYTGGFLDFVPATGPSWILYVGDDQSWRDVKTVPQVLALQAQGITLGLYDVTDPSCSPSRATTYRSENPLVHGILGVGGSAQEWIDRDLDPGSMGPLLAAAGVRCHFLGKWQHDTPMDGVYRPGGWSSCVIANDGYKGHQVEYLDWDGSTVTVDTTGTDEDEYWADFLSARAVSIIEQHAIDFPGQPVVIVIAVPNCHGNHGDDPINPGPSASPAPRDRPTPTGDELTQWLAKGWDPDGTDPNGNCGGISCSLITLGGEPWDNTPMLNAPAWHSSPASPGQVAEVEERMRDRSQADQSVGAIIDAVQAALVAASMDATTYQAYFTDNSNHNLEHCLDDGKSTPGLYDTRFPAIIVPPGGVTARVVDDEWFTNADWLPTMLESLGIPLPGNFDGRSMLPMIDDEPAREVRKRSLSVFRDNKTWEQRIDSGQAPPWDAIFGVDENGIEYRYVSYEPDSLTAPPPTKGEFHVITGPDADPYCMVNRYSELTLESRDAFHAALVATRDVTGTAARLVALDPLPIAEFGESDIEPPARRWFIQGVALPANIKLIEVSSPWPAPIGPPDQSMPGMFGILDAGVADVYAAGTTVWEFAPRDELADPFSETVRDSLDLIARLCTPGDAGAAPGRMVHVMIQFRDGQEREARVRVTNNPTSVKSGFYYGRLRVEFKIPEAFWRSPAHIVETVELDDWADGATTGTVRFVEHSLPGPTAPMHDGKLTVAGMPGPIRFLDTSSQATSFRYLGSVTGTQRLVFDFQRWKATLYADDDDNDGVDHSGPEWIERIEGIASWLVLWPSKNNARYSISLKLGGTPEPGAYAKLDGPARWLSANA